MKKLLIVLCTVVFAACSSMNFGISSLNPQTDIPEPANTESYELYSWHLNNDWAFALFPNATRVPSYQEITTSADTVIGMDALVESLLALPIGTKVYWNLKRINGMSLPDGKTIDKIKQATKKSFIQLEVIVWP